MARRIDVRLTIADPDLSSRLRTYIERNYGRQKGALTMTIRQAVKEFLDLRDGQPTVRAAARYKLGTLQELEGTRDER